MRLRHSAMAALAFVGLMQAYPAAAQYYDPYDRPPPPRYREERPPFYDEDGPRPYYERPRYGYDRPYRPRRFGDMCVTGRGDCQAPPSPIGAPCRCYIEGFGTKRGIIE